MCLSLSSSQLLLAWRRPSSAPGLRAGAREPLQPIGEDTIGELKKGRERVHLLACASTPTVQDSGREEKASACPGPEVLVNSEELMIVSADGFVLLSIATLVPDESLQAEHPDSVSRRAVEAGISPGLRRRAVGGGGVGCVCGGVGVVCVWCVGVCGWAVEVAQGLVRRTTERARQYARPRQHYWRYRWRGRR